tara:strand:+ start:179 stop:403 length:225 start_codon:yes stop_codon:yes gene_type:complete
MAPYNDYLVFETSQLQGNYSSLLEDRFADVRSVTSVSTAKLTTIELLSFTDPIPSKRRFRLDECRLITFQLLNT